MERSVLMKHYASRLERALNYIERNLNRPLELVVLAEQAAFSPYHFHRIFCQWHGETPQAYIRRQRLERSAALLHYGQRNNHNIAEIALSCGFTSVQAFDRAFRNYFGMTPSDWRVGGYNQWSNGTMSPRSVPLNLSPSQVQVKYLQPVHTMYSRKLGPYKEDQEQFWKRFAKQADAIGLKSQVCFGVGLDDPAVTPATRCRYDLCMELPSAISIPWDTPVKRIAGGPHAVLPFNGLVGEADDYWLWLLQIWLPQSGYTVGQSACFERYPNGLPGIGMVHSELCLPLAR
jgi:AraC family transcriptional regulator